MKTVKIPSHELFRKSVIEFSKDEKIMHVKRHFLNVNILWYRHNTVIVIILKYPSKDFYAIFCLKKSILSSV